MDSGYWYNDAHTEQESQLPVPKDGIYVVDLPETETILQYTEPDNKSGYCLTRKYWGKSYEHYIFKRGTEKIKQLAEQGKIPIRAQKVRVQKEAVSNFKERLKTEINRFYGNISRRDATSSQYVEGLADAYETVLELLDTTE